MECVGLHLYEIDEMLNELHNLVKESFRFTAMRVQLLCVKNNKKKQRASEVLERTTFRVEEWWETGFTWRCGIILVKF